MKLLELNNLIMYKRLLDRKIKEYKKHKIIRSQAPETSEILGHIEKSRHNLSFIKDNLNMGYLDWCITGCYYAVYHAALALLIAKGYFSKNHDSTLCILIKEYYNRGINEEDLNLINKFFIGYQDLLFYVESKNKRQDATYSTKYKFDKESVEDMRKKTILFVNKVKDILNNKILIKREVAIILFYDDKGNILLQDRKNYSKLGEEYGFFGGKIEEGETPEQALKREIKEELNIEIKDYKFFKKYRAIYPELNRDIIRNVFLAKMPEIKILKAKEGNPIIMKFKDSFNLKMISGDIELLKDIYKFLENQGGRY